MFRVSVTFVFAAMVSTFAVAADFSNLAKSDLGEP